MIQMIHSLFTFSLYYSLFPCQMTMSVCVVCVYTVYSVASHRINHHHQSRRRRRRSKDESRKEKTNSKIRSALAHCDWSVLNYFFINILILFELVFHISFSPGYSSLNRSLLLYHHHHHHHNGRSLTSLLFPANCHRASFTRCN